MPVHVYSATHMHTNYTGSSQVHTASAISMSAPPGSLFLGLTYYTRNKWDKRFQSSVSMSNDLQSLTHTEAHHPCGI